MGSRRLAAGVALLVVACSPEVGPRTVIARLADGTLTSVPTQEVRKHIFGMATRDGVRGAPDSAFEVSVPPGTSRVAVSLGVRGKPPCLVPVRHRVLAIAGSSPREVLDETPDPATPAWHDREIDLSAIAPRPERLRFETRAIWADGVQARACASQLWSWWGSVLAIGHPDPTPSVPARGPRDSLPNAVVLISLDTLGAAYLSSFGGPADVSPHLDAFLAESFSFRRAIAQYGHTRPSTASLFSGVYPHRHGAYPDDLLARFDSLVPALARAGYRCEAFTEGAYLGASFGMAQGFDAYDDGVGGTETASRSDAATTFERAAQWLEAHGAEQRFFLFIHSYEVHLPYLPRDAEALAVARRLTPGVERFFTRELQLRAMLDHNRGARLLDDDEIAHLLALHASEIHYLDRVLGQFLDRLAALGLARDTLVIVSADHGDQFGERGKLSHGESLHNRVHHVPLGFRWPARIAPGASDSPVQLVDLMPSLLDLVGIPAPAELDGRSLASAVLGLGTLAPRPAFSELRSPPGECERLGISGPCRLGRLAVQTGRFKLEVSEQPPSERLYDLVMDPLEEHDVAGQHPEALAELREALATYRSGMNPSAPARAADSSALDPATRRQLEDLGYLAPSPPSPESNHAN